MSHVLIAAALVVQQQITLTRELVIGADPSGPEYEFIAAGPAVAMRSGTVFIVAWEGGMDGQIRRFNPAGRFVSDVGRPGSGPGEYRLIEGMALSGDTLLFVFDGGSRRVSVFAAAGAYRRSFPVSGGGFSSLQSFSLTNGILAVRAMAVPLPRGSSLDAIHMPTVFIRYRLDGSVVDSIPAPPIEVGGMMLNHRSLGARWAFPATTVSTMLASGGIASATTTAYRIEVAPAAGQRFVIERTVRPLPLSGPERDDWQALVDMVPGGRTQIPRQKPIIRELQSDEGGRLWVSLYTQATHRANPPREGAPVWRGLTWWEHNAYDVFDPRGVYLGRVDLPPFSKLLTVLGDRIWITEETEDGGYTLVRYRMAFPHVR